LYNTVQLLLINYRS